MKCEQIHLLLAVSSREWSAAERVLVEAHLAACPGCAVLARQFASQEQGMAALPRSGLSRERQAAILDQARREAGWLRWRIRVSNALGVAAAALLILFMGVALSALLRHAPAAAAPPTVTAGSPTRTATSQPAVTARAASPAGEVPRAPLILVDNGPRSGLGPSEPWPPPDLYTVLGEGNYQVRYRSATEGIQPEPGLGIELTPITAEELTGVDLLIVPWTSCYAAGGSAGGGTTVYDFNLTSEEAQTIRAFVAGGGQALFILDPTYQCHFETLSDLGVEADASQAIAWDDEAFHTAAGRLNGRSFTLAAQYRFQPVRSLSGESWAQLDGQGALAVEPIGRGRVAVLGLPLLVNGNGMRSVSDVADEGQPAPLFAADNLAFLVGVVEELTDTPSGLDVETIVWEGQRGALQLAAERLVERLDAWTEQRITWAAPDEVERQALSAEVLALRTHFEEGVHLLDGLLESGPDPARYEAVRGILREVLAGANRLGVLYGPAASESWEGRQARRLQPWLLGLLGGAVLLGVVAWRVRRLDEDPAALAQQGVALLPYAVAALLLLVHLLAAADMVGFGLRAGGYPLNRWGVWGYAALAVLAALAFFLPARRGGCSLTRLALPLLAVLALMQAHFLTDLAGAEYATYRSYEQGIGLMANLAVALAFCLTGVLYRRPGWLAVMAGVHLALALGVMGGSSLSYALREGFQGWQVSRVLLPPSPLSYLAILYGLGLLAARPVRPRVYWSAFAGLLGLFVAGGTVLVLRGDTWMDSGAPDLFDWLTNLLLIPLLLTLGVLSAAYAWHNRRAIARRLPLASPLAATVLLLWLAASLMPALLSASSLPASGAAMPWLGAAARVPAGAWSWLLPVARVLANIALWTILPIVALQTGQWVGGLRLAPASIPGPVRRRLLALTAAYALLLTAAVTVEILTSPQPYVLSASPWEDPRARVLWAGLASVLSVGLLTAWLGRRSGPGRWGGLIYGLALVVQILTWTLGLGRLRSFGGLSALWSLLQGIPLSSASDLVGAGLSALALAALVWHMVIAALALRKSDHGGGSSCPSQPEKACYYRP